MRTRWFYLSAGVLILAAFVAAVKLRLMPSAGAVENLNRSSDPRSGVSVGSREAA